MDFNFINMGDNFMYMLNKHSLLFIALFTTANTFANIPIESRGLSQNGGSTSATTNVTRNLNWELIQKNQTLESDIRTLRGQLEVQQNMIEQLKNEITNRYTDLDQRLELLTQRIDPESSPTDEAVPSTDTSASQAAQSNNPVSAPVVNATPIVNPTTPSTTTSSAQTATTPTTNIANPAELEKAAYTVALDAYKQGGAKKAIAPMQNFIRTHPNGIYTGNAYFWLAEFNLAIDPANYDEAKKNYAVVANQYSNSSKASRALYQLYSIAKDVDRNPTLATQYKSRLLAQFPNSQEAAFVK